METTDKISNPNCRDFIIEHRSVCLFLFRLSKNVFVRLVTSENNNNSDHRTTNWGFVGSSDFDLKGLGISLKSGDGIGFSRKKEKIRSANAS